jgi:hypothetical protein
MTSKFDRYIIKRPKAQAKTHEEMDTPDVMTPLLWMDDSVIKGAFYLECNWFHKPTQFSPKPHTHEFDEVLAYIGMDPEKPNDLNGEVEFWIEDEKLTVTESCIIYVPKGLTHCPMHIRRADRPIFHFSCGMAENYVRGNQKDQD